MLPGGTVLWGIPFVIEEQLSSPLPVSDVGFREVFFRRSFPSYMMDFMNACLTRVFPTSA